MPHTNNIRKILLPAVIALALWLMHAYNVSTSFRQSTVWTAPYLSAAANLAWPLSFKIDVEEIKNFNRLDDTRAEDQYQFHKSSRLTPYQYNDLGYVYLVWFATHIFPFLGGQKAIIFFQALVHLLLCSLLLSNKAFPKLWRLCFLLLYAVNPLVLKYVVFNHYYFWQSVPSLLVVFLTFRTTNSGFLYVSLLLLPWAILARSTTILLAPVIGYLLYQHCSRRTLVMAVSYCALIWFFFYKPSQKNMWHTAYVGTGAYQNPYGVRLSDNDGFDLYKKEFGIKLSASTGGNLYAPDVYAKYRTLSKHRYLTQLKESPGLYLKNALVNSLGAYSLGYLSGKSDWVNYLLALLGLMVAVIFVRFNQWIFLLSIGLLSFSYTLYYPPVPAYMYGNYALIVGGVLTCFMRFREKDQENILYLSFNDGSDMRVTKELHTLGQATRVSLIAVGTDLSHYYAAESVHTLHFIRGNRRSPGTLFRYFFTCARLLLTQRYYSVHIINEPQLLVLWPFLWLQKRVVLDLFDSIFLRKNRPGNRSLGLKKLVYAPVDRTLVTDQNRLGLLPDFLKSQALVLPNYPYELSDPPRKVRSPHLTLMYYGWLGELRGTETARELLAADPELHLLMAGWLADDTSRALTQHPRVTWLGVLPQAEALSLAAEKADYILCVYAPTNDNNINASPNKIYDAIQTQTPVIINAEVKVSNFVKVNKIGFVLDQYRPANYISLGNVLFSQRESYELDVSLSKKYTWKNAESALLTAHGL